MVRDFSSLSLELITDRALEKTVYQLKLFCALTMAIAFEPMVLGDHADGW
jgi:hypothetical protein